MSCGTARQPRGIRPALTTNSCLPKEPEVSRLDSFLHGSRAEGSLTGDRSPSEREVRLLRKSDFVTSRLWYFRDYAG